MKTSTKNISLPVNFKQVVELVMQLPYEEEIKLWKVIRQEANKNLENDKVLTHYASEKSLALDWLSPVEDEAWKNL